MTGPLNEDVVGGGSKPDESTSFMLNGWRTECVQDVISGV
jgi:hypothetical protein